MASSPSASVPVRLVLLGALLSLALVLARCTDTAEESLGAGVHSWGTYALCLQRTLDTCHAAQSACESPAVDASRSATLGVRPDGTFLWSRPGLAPAEGRQVGDAFALALAPVQLPHLCDCPVQVQETVRGELLVTTLDQSACTAADGGSASCTAPDAAPSPDGGTALPDAGAPFDPDSRYGALAGHVVDEVHPVGDGRDCTCPMPCRIEYDLRGSL